MSSMSSLGTAYSGLKVNQVGLQVTGHNLTNASSKGFTRQRVNLHEAFYSNIGNTGGGMLSIGRGVQVSDIMQIRDRFLDQSFRTETSRYAFYSDQKKGVEELEAIFGEKVGSVSFSDTLNQMNDALNELVKNPSGLDTRGVFVQTASLFVEQSNYIYNQMVEYQNNLNQKVINDINKVNGLCEQIRDLNDKIAFHESSGDNANDLRDSRNLCLDELSSIVEIQYREERTGRVTVSIEGHQTVFADRVFKMEPEYIGKNSSFVKPVWKDTKKDVFLAGETISADKENDMGSLKSNLHMRGEYVANYNDISNPAAFEKIDHSNIMTMQAKFDQLVHNVVTKMNNVLSPYDSTSGLRDDSNCPIGLDGSKHLELFSRKDMSRYDSTGHYNAEDPTNKQSLYSAGNLSMNLEILNDPSKLALSMDLTDVSDATVVNKMLEQWQLADLKTDPSNKFTQSITDYYSGVIGDLGAVGQDAKSKLDNQAIMLKQIDNQRQSMSGVSTDEELSNMMKYQHGYNASARVISVLDKMMEQIVTSLGVVGR